MKTIFALFLVLATVYRGAESASKCFKAASGPGYAAGVAGDCADLDLCFENVKVAVADGAKLFEKGCVKPCTPTGTAAAPVGVPALNSAGTMWELQNCCDGDAANSGDTPAGAADCNSIDLSTTATLGPKCMECADSTDEKCVKGGETAADPYKEGTGVCNVLTSSCYVEMNADGTVTRGCKAACADAGKPGDATFTKCCITKNNCNQDDATKTPTDGGDGDGDGDKDGGAQAVFASYALLFSCLLLAYLK